MCNKFGCLPKTTSLFFSNVADFYFILYFLSTPCPPLTLPPQVLKVHCMILLALHPHCLASTCQ